MEGERLWLFSLFSLQLPKAKDKTSLVAWQLCLFNFRVESQYLALGFYYSCCTHVVPLPFYNHGYEGNKIPLKITITAVIGMNHPKTHESEYTINIKFYLVTGSLFYPLTVYTGLLTLTYSDNESTKEQRQRKNGIIIMAIVKVKMQQFITVMSFREHGKYPSLS